MFAKTENIDITNNDHLLVVLGEYCIVDDLD